MALFAVEAPVPFCGSKICPAVRDWNTGWPCVFVITLVAVEVVTAVTVPVAGRY